MKTILLAKDDPFIVGIYADKFRKECFKIDIAKDSQMALEKIKNNYPDLLLLDIKWPKEDKGLPLENEGWEILKIIRRDPKTQNLKVIVLSNDNSEYNVHNITNFGVIKYFLKVESNPDEILSTIKGILK